MLQILQAYIAEIHRLLIIQFWQFIGSAKEDMIKFVLENSRFYF